MARKSRKNTAQTPAVKTGMKVWKAALYIRLSVEFNGQRGDSLETQKKIMECQIRCGMQYGSPSQQVKDKLSYPSGFQ